MADRRIAWGIALIAALCIFLGWSGKWEESRLLGVAVADAEKLGGLCGNRQYVEKPENAAQFLCFMDKPVPYNKETNTFYIIQNADTENYEGQLTAPDGVTLFFEGEKTDKQATLEQGTQFSLWIMTKYKYTVCHLLFTGLPVVTADTDGGIGTEYKEAKVTVWEPYNEEIRTIAVKNTNALAKASASGETITLKLMQDDGINRQKLQFLSSGKYDAWKLYKVSEKDDSFIRSMLSHTIWNGIQPDLQNACFFIELVADGVYQGLYLFSPRIDDDFFGEEGVSVFHIEEDGEQEISAVAWEKLEPENLSGFAAFLQATYAYKNRSDDLYYVVHPEGEFIMPGRVEYSFGIFPNRLEYLSYHASERILTAAELPIPEEMTGKLEKETALLWQSLRTGVLSDDTLFEEIDEMEAALKQSGFIARSGMNDTNGDLSSQDNGDNPSYTERYGRIMDEFKEALSARLLAADSYYDAIAAEQEKLCDAVATD